MEFTLSSALGAQASIAARQPARKAPDPTRVEKANNTGKPRADAHNSQDHGTQRILHQPPDPDQPVGPPPSFQLNILEMERELQQRLAKIEVSRTLVNEASAPNSTPPATQTDDPPILSVDVLDSDRVPKGENMNKP
ncbi:hypothetical protein [Aliiroseovarius sp. F20344]|uniref:hypothetical protein n=1 Tax=Aliiroseovarius sp. F20344 TaxID=2926414 RepID=UPI001FF6B194|nr:hypothetical protein [Aliiroseovarius sp. F20344]MCK0143129.1 hypothetical protein [Aliiroseovarius sp. F20344]